MVLFHEDIIDALVTSIKKPDQRQKQCDQDGKRVGSSLVVHARNSLRLGAASACEFEEVKSVNVNGFFGGMSISYTRKEEQGCRGLPQGVIPFLDCFLC
jgi:hypothetical protein